MSKRRGIILCVVVEGLSQAETARLYGVSRGWVSKLIARYRIEGEAAFEPRSRRPKTSPNATPGGVVELITNTRRTLTDQGLDAGAETIGWHLKQHHDVTVSASTIRRQLHRAGLIILMLINNLNIRIINPTTGELLRQLTLNPNRDYQPQNQT